MSIILKLSKKLFKKYTDKNSIVVDATCGNGYDTLFLAQNSKFVYSFDIQKQAIENAKKLNYKFKNIEFINDGHENLDKYITNRIDLVVFNLGYLPKFNKEITTRTETTLTALKKSLNLLNNQKAVIITVYPGHKEGKKESEELQKYLSGLNFKQFDVFIHKLINKPNNPPYILEITKRN